MSTWVLLRGLMRESRHWGDFPDHLQKMQGVQQIVTLDFPGNGRLYEQSSLSSVSSMADFCHAQMGKSGYAPPYHVLALSLGAMVGVAWNNLYPAEIKKLVLINTSLAPFNPFYHRLSPRNYAALIRFLIFASDVGRERLILHLTSSHDRSAILHRWAGYAREYPITRCNILQQLFAAITYRAATVPPSVPVLLLAGQQDRLVNVKCSLKLAELWGCVIRVHPLAGHDLPLDDALWVVRQIEDWLAVQAN
jgi:pimeloyl-ACP methyl ester carboxylesterase